MAGDSHSVDFSSGDIALLNPVTRAQILLPPISTFTDPPDLPEEDRERNIQYIERATISTSPSYEHGTLL
ncbi:hypothetical protein L1049_025631 [Liquidambar formosana]|uniref:Uncharacterized protein n=1 Tax=Liquidambar formosana TaxID=63359 RepID=A0AAP0R6P8_LIQFO